VHDLSGKLGAFGASHSKAITDIDFSKDGTMMVSSGRDGNLKVWKIPSGEVTQTISPKLGSISAVRFVDNTKLCFVCSSGAVCLWDLASGSLVYATSDSRKKVRGFAVSPDATMVAVGGNSKDVHVYDLATGVLSKKLMYHQNWVRSLAFSPDSKLLASGGDDKKIILWDVEKGEVAREFVEKGWTHDLEFSADGKYLSASLERYALNFYNVKTGVAELKLKDFNSGVLRASISSLGNEVATIEEFGPEVSLWNIESLGIAPAINFRDNNDRTAPMLMISNPANIVDNRSISYQDVIDLRGVVIDESGVRSLKINNIETPIRNNGNFVINLPLAMGENAVTIETRDVNDNIALKKFTVTRKSMDGEKAYDPKQARNYLLVIGINSYQHWPQLNNAVKDINDLVRILISKYNFEFDNITLIKDEQATRTGIYNGLRGMIEKITPQDNLVIYFSGHGYFDQLLNEGYWIPVDAHQASAGEYISNTEILKIIGNVGSQHTFLIADACFSGALFSDQTRSFADHVEKFRSRWALASGRLEVVSDGQPGSNSPFAQHVLKFLDTNEKDRFAISELIHYVKLQVAEVSDQTPIGNPLRALGDEGGEMVFYRKR
jgi:hypothetical protein